MQRARLPRSVSSRSASVSTGSPSPEPLPVTRIDPPRGVSRAASAATSGVDLEQERAANNTADAAPEAKRPSIRIITARRREQCRQSQARYRRRQNGIVVDLEIEVQRLQLEILHLEDRRRVLRNALNAFNAQERCVRMLKELCRVFQTGVRSADAAASDQGNYEQIAFVDSHFHPRAQINGGRGREIFLQQMKWLATAFEGVELEMLGCRSLGKNESSTSLEMDQRLSVTVSEATIRLVFPHLNTPEQYCLKHKLLGTRLELNASTLVVCDKACHVIVWDSAINVVIVLQRMLPMAEAAEVLGQARIDPGGWVLQI